MMFCLVRTDPEAPKHRGISYVLVDMRSPGITVRPLIQMTGAHNFNEVFFDNVRVPRENLVGKLNEGWLVANATLFHERNMLGSTTTSQQSMARLIALARSVHRNGRPLTADPVFRQRLVDLEMRVEAMKYHMLRQLTDQVRGRNPGIEAMINKLAGTELNHDIATAAMEAMGDYAMLARGEEEAMDRAFWPYEWMFSLGLVIGGGTSHVQKNIIAERGLKMPKSR
jgi:alkylation response protein AidB-like acyl-CoA dehydrogenase